MSDPRDELPDAPALHTLEPPPGGLAALQARLDGDRPVWRWWFAMGPAVAIAVLVVWLARGTGTPVAPPIALAPPTAIADPTIARGDVEFYWVSSAPRPVRAAPVAAPIVAQVSIADVALVATMP